jgi:hypothetical protein
MRKFWRRQKRPHLLKWLADDEKFECMRTQLTLADLGTELNILLRTALNLLLWWHVCL